MAHRSARYDYGGDRYVFVEFSIDMELAQNFKTLSMAEAIKQARIPGIVEVIPSICSMLVEYDRTKLHADSLIGRLKGIEQSMTQLTQIPTRIIDFPILFADPWTTECAEAFKGHHNTGEVPNIDFVARENHFSDRESFI
ncbi:MAG: carboxyltransferase domain-containing protein, partial [Methanobacteriota archaeon]